MGMEVSTRQEDFAQVLHQVQNVKRFTLLERPILDNIGSFQCSSLFYN